MAHIDPSLNVPRHWFQSGYNPYISALVWGGGWADSTDSIVIYYDFESGPVTSKLLKKGAVGAIWQTDQIDSIVQALSAWSSVSKLSFAESTGSGNTDVSFYQVSSSTFKTPGADGASENPDGHYSEPLKTFFSTSAIGGPEPVARGSYAFTLMLHEIGHALGLAHPFDRGGNSGLFPGVSNGVSADLGDHNLDHGFYTVMSYNWSYSFDQNGELQLGNTSYIDQNGDATFGTNERAYGYFGGPMAFDIAAMQALYGPSAENVGDDIYVLPDSNEVGTFWSCIYDTGGTDAIVYNGPKDAIINLVAATLDDSSTGGGVPSYARFTFGGFTIAAGVEIENATGGYGNDRINGNALANLLSGDPSELTGGDDAIFGAQGDDILNGGAGNDSLDGQDDNDVIHGARDDDVLIGGPGTDTLDGGEGVKAGSLALGALDPLFGDFDVADYRASPGAVNVSLTTGFALDGFGSVDTLANIEGIYGSNFGDMLVGGGPGSTVSTAFEAFAGMNGDDTIDGRDGFDSAWYVFDPGRVIVNLSNIPQIVDSFVVEPGKALDGWGNTDTLIGIEGIRGSSFDDWMFGSDASDRFQGGMGSDHFIGGGGLDEIDFMFAGATSGAVVDLAAGMAFDGLGGTDIFTGIENIRGSELGDTLLGDDTANRFRPMDGADFVDGRGGTDTVDYLFEPNSVTVNLAEGTTVDGYGNVDTLIGVENVNGSLGGDTIIGNEESNQLFGDSGDDILHGGGGDDSLFGGSGNDTLHGDGDNDFLIGGLGDDTLDGGDGIDEATYFEIPRGGPSITVNLLTGTANDGRGGSDTLISIENVLGGNGDDTIIGDNSDNVLRGNAGTDTIYGGGGNDIVRGNDGHDILYGGEGNDLLQDGGDTGGDEYHGGVGDDTLEAGSGDDTFVFEPGCGNDTISNFVAGAGSPDKIDLTAFDFADIGELQMTEVADGVVINLDVGDSIEILGVQIAALHSDDFVL